MHKISIGTIYMTQFHYDRLEKLRHTHAAIKLLHTDLSPLVISFLHQSFIEHNRRSVPFNQLINELDDYLYILRERKGADKFARSALQYLNEWTSESVGYLR
ncbi:MAG: DUF3375 family protein, partial [Gammaproteobacteria bacterium]|nr:DUF3375 family protein [Gammaproteobacteria bacterium]